MNVPPFKLPVNSHWRNGYIKRYVLLLRKENSIYIYIYQHPSMSLCSFSRVRAPTCASSLSLSLTQVMMYVVWLLTCGKWIDK